MLRLIGKKPIKEVGKAFVNSLSENIRFWIPLGILVVVCSLSIGWLIDRAIHINWHEYQLKLLKRDFIMTQDQLEKLRDSKMMINMIKEVEADISDIEARLRELEVGGIKE